MRFSLSEVLTVSSLYSVGGTEMWIPFCSLTSRGKQLQVSAANGGSAVSFRTVFPTGGISIPVSTLSPATEAKPSV